MHTPSGQNGAILVLALAAAVVGAACMDVSPPATGTLQVSLSTTGVDLDTNNAVLLDGNAAQPVLANGTVTFDAVTSGSHTITVRGLTANCTDPGNPHTVIVRADQTIQLVIAVSCVANVGGVAVTDATAGAEPDADGYTLLMDGQSVASLPDNGSTIVTPVAAGSHVFLLTGLAANCRAAGQPIVANVVFGQTTAVAFSVSCPAPSSLRVTVATSGVDPDLNGYDLEIDDSVFPGQRIGANTDTLISGLHPGSYRVSLLDVAENCQVTDGATRSVDFPEGGTATVLYQVSCVKAHLIAFVREDGAGDYAGIAAVRPDGSGLTPLTSNSEDHSPAWSPDGGTIAFVRTEPCNQGSCPHLFTMHADGTDTLDMLEGDAQAYFDGLAWRPDGTRIAFGGSYAGAAGLYLVNPDGSNLTPLIAVAGAGHPSWSPDGSRLAFHCAGASGNSDICIVNADGTGLTHLTNDPDPEYEPAWKPDGTRIVFVESGSLALINPDGSALTQFAFGELPSWSPDGLRVAFVVPGTSGYSSYWTPDEIELIHTDGTGLVVLNEAGTEPAWQP